MAQSIAGGAYVRGDVWVDAQGQPLTKEQQRLQTTHAQTQQQTQQAREAAQQAPALQQDRTVGALVEALKVAFTPAAPEPTKDT